MRTTIALVGKPVNTFFTLDTNFRSRYIEHMAELRVANFDDELMARLKAAAALARLPMNEFIPVIIAQVLKLREGRKRP